MPSKGTGSVISARPGGTIGARGGPLLLDLRFRTADGGLLGAAFLAVATFSLGAVFLGVPAALLRVFLCLFFWSFAMCSTGAWQSLDAASLSCRAVELHCHEAPYAVPAVPPPLASISMT
jgi:hypothetical protein